jgi:2-(1,2-epoxy-1,2-dihydrophenyl)acetyl-CoA isomerase
MSEVVLLDRPAPNVARLRINRPAKRNAIDDAVREGLLDGLATVRSDASVRALVLGGVEGVFSAGGDLPSMAGLDAAGAAARMRQAQAVCRALTTSGLAVVSAVEGVAAGAAVGLALLGDHIVVGPGTRILFPFLRLGLAPDWGQVFTLPRRVGQTVAWRLMTSSTPVSGEEALRIGLADQMAADGDVMRAALAEAARRASLPIDALRRTRARLLAPSASLDEELAREETDQIACLTGEEFREGYAAFFEKRAPEFPQRKVEDKR